jgi:hypothetical protein
MPKGGARGEYPRKQRKKNYEDPVEIRIRCNREFRDKLDEHLKSIGVRPMRRNQWLIKLIEDAIG